MLTLACPCPARARRAQRLGHAKHERLNGQKREDQEKVRRGCLASFPATEGRRIEVEGEGTGARVDVLTVHAKRGREDVGRSHAPATA
eukprot:3265407-Pleurochrysis_carterae.AAC.2